MFLGKNHAFRAKKCRPQTLNRSFYENKPFFLPEKAVLSMRESRSLSGPLLVGNLACLIPSQVGNLACLIPSQVGNLARLISSQVGNLACLIPSPVFINTEKAESTEEHRDDRCIKEFGKRHLRYFTERAARRESRLSNSVPFYLRIIRGHSWSFVL